LGWIAKLHVALLGLQIGDDFAFASLQAAQLVAYRTRIAGTPGDEVQAAFDATICAS
jgi:hypothetical protein